MGCFRTVLAQARPKMWVVSYRPSCWYSRHGTALVFVSARHGPKYFMPCRALSHAKWSCRSRPSPSSRWVVAHLSAKNNCLLRSWMDLRGTGCALWRLIVGKEPARLPLRFIVAPFATRSVRSQTQRPSDVPRPPQPVGGAVEPEQRIEERPGGVLPDSSSHCRSRWLRWVTALVRSLFDLSHWDVSLPKLEHASPPWF